MPAETVTLMDLWLPILLSSVGVFFASSLVWMVLPHHKKDWAKLPDEDGVMSALRQNSPAPGQYHFPYCQGGNMKDEAWMEKLKQGPVGFMIVKPSGMPNMGKNLGQWFAYLIVVGVFVAYLSSQTLVGGEEYLRVFQIAGASAFLAYAMSEIPAAIWWGHSWSSSMKGMVDGLAYSLITAGVFGWLWPGGAV